MGRNIHESKIQITCEKTPKGIAKEHSPKSDKANLGLTLSAIQIQEIQHPEMFIKIICGGRRL